MRLRDACWKFGRTFRHRGFRARIWQLLSGMAYAFALCSGLIAATTKIDVDGWPAWAMPLAKATIVPMKERAWWLSPAFLIALGVLTFVRKQIGEPWVWRTIHALMDDYRAFFYCNIRNDMPHEHRVTLFKLYGRWHPYCWFLRPWTSHLVAVARSGHLTLEMNSVFAVSPDATTITGVAGQAYAARRTIGPVKLPKVNGSSSQNNLAKYAERSFATVDYVQSSAGRLGRVMPRALLAFPVNVRGKTWGVVVLDSTEEASLDGISSSSYDVMAKTLGKMLERV